MFEGHFNELFESTRKCSERFGKINEYFPIQELGRDFEEMMNPERLPAGDPLIGPVTQFNQDYTGLVQKARQAFKVVRDWAESRGIEKDMGMPHQEELQKWVYPMWDEGFVWIDLERGNDSSLVHALTALVEYAKMLGE